MPRTDTHGNPLPAKKPRRRSSERKPRNSRSREKNTTPTMFCLTHGCVKEFTADGPKCLQCHPDKTENTKPKPTTETQSQNDSKNIIPQAGARNSHDTCPDCHLPLIHESGCTHCICGYTTCPVS